MNYELSVPSKTFILGEYAVLKGSSGIVLTTQPRFKLSAAKGKGSVEGINPESPAGKLIQRHPQFFQLFKIKFIDPYNHLGGFGASSAQFVLLEGLKSYVEQQTLTQNDLLADYLACSETNNKLPPSGADVIAQLHGKLCVVNRDEKKVQTFTWVFPHLSYALLHTGHKIKTFHHLKNLGEFDFSIMQEIVQQGIQSLETKNSDLFIEAINSYANEMQAQNLVADHTTDMIKVLQNCSSIDAAKGCGGLAADVVFIVFEKSEQTAVLSWLNKRKFHVIACGQSVAEGLTMQCEAKIGGVYDAN